MRQSTTELWVAFVAIVVITLLYLFVTITFSEIPPARSFYGHSLGILGFILMLLTETLYSYRKRSRLARGRMASWLQLHIFTGIVGPYMVLLHSSWKLNGVAGVVLLLTIVVVVSGFVGRYIYTAVPRNAEGAVIETRELELAISDTENKLQAWWGNHADAQAALRPVLAGTRGYTAGSVGLIFGRGVRDFRSRIRWRLAKRQVHGTPRREMDQLEELVRRRQMLERQIASLAMARRMLSLWHSIHVPIGMTLFFLAFVHIAGAIYYASLLR
jgi:hypothetical protein